MSDPSFIRPDALWRELGLRANQRVVHLGCGAGFYIIPAAKIVGKHGKVFGIDVRGAMLEEAEGRARHEGVADVVETIRADLESSKSSTLPASKADWVLVANILHQAQPDKVLAEARRVLRKDGTAVIIEWDTAATPLGPPADQRISRQHVGEVAESVGLRVDHFFAPSPYHYGIVLKPAA